MNYDLHEKANDLKHMHRDMKDRINFYKSILENCTDFPDIATKHLNRIDTCKRGLERIEQAYIKVLTEILAV